MSYTMAGVLEQLRRPQKKACLIQMLWSSRQPRRYCRCLQGQAFGGGWDDPESPDAPIRRS